jgi:hypothetical protein
MPDFGAIEKSAYPKPVVNGIGIPSQCERKPMRLSSSNISQQHLMIQN